VLADELGAFAAAFLDLDLTVPDPCDRLAAATLTAGVKSIRVEKRDERPDEPVVLEDRREMAMRSYLRGLRAFKEVLRSEGFRDRSKIRRARRAVQGLVDHFLEDETAVLALAQIRGHDLKLFHHSLNVCVYSLSIGQRLGMSRRQLGELGLAALFHDLGKTVSNGEWPEEIRQHPSRGARRILEEGTVHEGMLKAAIAAYEHHVHHDGTGFPEVEHPPHFVSRIVAIADCYESLTAASTFRETPYPPHQALQLMRSKAGKLLDPLLLKVFIAALGVHPPGSLVELDTGEVAIVTAGPQEPGGVRVPQLRVVSSGRGALLPGKTVDLSACDEAGRPLHRVVRTVASHEVFESAGRHVQAI